MRTKINIFILLFCVCSCSDNELKNNVFSGLLKNSKWSSDFYYYHNNYIFLNDHSGIGEDCMRARGLGDLLTDTLIDDDSILEGEIRPFYYQLKDSTLVIFFPETPYSDSNRRIFRRKINDGDTSFVSEYEYVYGREVLVRTK